MPRLSLLPRFSMILKVAETDKIAIISMTAETDKFDRISKIT